MKLGTISGRCAIALMVAFAGTSVRGAGLSGDIIETQGGNIVIHPINHATFALQWKDTTVYVDPVGGAERFKSLPEPQLILITDIHQDHLDQKTLSAIAKPGTKIVAPQAVAEQLPGALREHATILKNGETSSVAGISIEAVAAYNITPERQKFHAKGRGNGYVLTIGGKRIYISGDTENTPEMKALKNIDVAFLCMNLPYTMTIEQAGEAVRAFKPHVVYPYHYRGSDVEQFRKIVDSDSEVRLRDWYAKP